MNGQPQLQSQRPTAATMPTEDDFQRLLQRDAKTTVSYVPYGAKDEIKLTATNVQNLIAVRTKKGHTCSTRDALKFIAMCQAKRLNPFEGDCFLIGYDTQDGPSFALVTAHQTYLKRAELHDEFDGMTSGLIIKEEDGKLLEIEGDFYEEGQQVVGGWAKVHFKKRTHPMYKRLRLSRFVKGFGVWRDDAAGMICKCAEADALRSAFPTMLGGLYMQEEREPEQPKLERPDFSKPANNPLFAPSKAAPAPQPEPEPEPIPDDSNPELMPQRAAEAPQPDAEPEHPAKQNYLRAVRLLCQSVKVKEAELLNYMSDIGLTDGSSASLDEVAMAQPDALQAVHDRWQDVSSKIIAARKAGGK